LEWKQDQQDASDDLKKRLTKAPVFDAQNLTKDIYYRWMPDGWEQF